MLRSWAMGALSIDTLLCARHAQSIDALIPLLCTVSTRSGRCLSLANIMCSYLSYLAPSQRTLSRLKYHQSCLEVHNIISSYLQFVHACTHLSTDNTNRMDLLTALTRVPWPRLLLWRLTHSFPCSMHSRHGRESSHLRFSCLQFSQRSFTNFGPRPTCTHSSPLPRHREHGRWLSHCPI